MITSRKTKPGKPVTGLPGYKSNQLNRLYPYAVTLSPTSHRRSHPEIEKPPSSFDPVWGQLYCLSEATASVLRTYKPLECLIVYQVTGTNGRITPFNSHFA